MRQYSIDARNIKNPIYPCPIQMGGKNANGQMLSIGNYYLSLDGKPFFGVCGEAHFSRMNRELWEDEIIKMKAGGLNIIATYIFWIHHEEIEGTFDFSGNKDLRFFLELCKKIICMLFYVSVPFPMENAEMAVFLTGSMVSLSIFAAMILPICIIPDAFMNRSINRLKDCYSKTMVLSLVYSWRTNMSMLPVPGK